MIEYMLLGAWILVLIILGVIVTFTGIPDVMSDDEKIGLGLIKMHYLVALSVTMYSMGAHFGGM